MSVEDIRPGLMSVDIDCGARSESCGGGRGLLDQDQCRLKNIWLGSIPVRY